MTEEEKKIKAFPEIKIEQVVEEYGELKLKYKELDVKEKELKEVLTNYFEKKGVREVLGGRHRVFQVINKKVEYDEGEVRKILEPQGLWERVVSLDEKMLRELLKDAHLPPGIKKQLDSIKKAQETSQIRWGKVRDNERNIDS